MRDFLKYTLATVTGIILSGVLGFLLLFAFLSAIISWADKPVLIKDNSVLVIRLDGTINERSSWDPLGKIDWMAMDYKSGYGLDDILSAIREAKQDDRIRGIYLNPSVISAGTASVEEIREALADFKTSGKFVYAYGENLSQKAYYLSSVADKIMINPRGSISFHGLAVVIPFFTKALDKLGIHMQIIRHGKYKAAVEPFLRQNMSAENKLQTGDYLNSIWSRMVQDISVSRGISVKKLNQIADSVAGLQNPDYFLKMHLADTLLYKDQVIALMKSKLIGAKQDGKVLNTISLRKYINASDFDSPLQYTRNKIAVVYAEGDIDGGTRGDQGIDSEKLSQALREAREDSDVKAVVLRINSPGGSAYGAEVIWREVKLTARVKPVIASMGDMAASGGYYIAAAANTIMADPTTITGSIGIFGIIPDLSGFMEDKLGITTDGVRTNKHADLGSVTRPLTSDERRLIQRNVEYGYHVFVNRVAEGRHMSPENVDHIGQGRVWSAVSARQIGLVDSLGNFRQAVSLAQKMAGLTDYRLEKLPLQENSVEQIVKQLGTSVRAGVLKTELGQEYGIYKKIHEALHFKGIMARAPLDIAVN